MSGFVNVLKNVLFKVFSTVLEPVLSAYIQIWWTIVKSIIGTWWGMLLYFVYKTMLKTVDLLNGILNIFSGVDKVNLIDNGETLNISFIEVFFKLDVVSKGFLAFTLLGIALTLIFTIYATVKSMSSMTLENKNPISKVLTNCMKSMTMFAMIPILCLFLLNISSAMMISLNNAFLVSNYKDLGVEENFKQPSLGTMIFLNTSYRASYDDKYNIDKMLGPFTSSSHYTPTMTDPVRSPYFMGTKSVYDLEAVTDSFRLIDVDYFVGYLTAGFMIFVLSGTIIMFIKRIFEIILLYLVAPFFAATIPLDDGAMFKRWRDKFVTKFFTCFGSIIAMNLFMVFVPALMFTQDLVFIDESPMLSYIIKLLFICGGAFAIFKGQHLVTEILDEQEAENERRSMMFIASTAKKAASTAAQAGAAVATGGSSALAAGATKAMGAAAKAGQAAQKFGQAGAKALGRYAKSGDKNEEGK